MPQPMGMRQQGSPAPGSALGQTIMVQVPQGHGPGMQFQVRAPQGNMVMVQVPQGYRPGMQFQAVVPPAQPVQPVPVQAVAAGRRGQVPMAAQVEVVGPAQPQSNADKAKAKM